MKTLTIDKIHSYGRIINNKSVQIRRTSKSHNMELTILMLLKENLKKHNFRENGMN